MKPDQTRTQDSSDRTAQMGGIWAVLASLLWLFQAVLIADVFADLLAGRPSQPILMAGVFFLLSLLRAGFSTLSQSALAAAAQARIDALRNEVLARETATLSRSALGGPGALASFVTEKSEALRPYLQRYKPARLRVVVLPLIILAVAMWYSWAVALVLLAAGPLIPLFMALVGWAAKEASARQMQEIGDLGDLLADRLAALSDLRLAGAGPQVVRGFADASETLRGKTMAVLRIAFLSSTVLELFSALGVAMVAVWVGFSLLGEITWGAWGEPLTPFAGILLLLLAPDFFQPLRDLAAAWHDKSAADAVSEELARWRADDRPALMGTGQSDVALRFARLVAVDLSADRGGRVIRYPDIAINQGDSIALTGPSGVGKTTLLRLLAGLEVPQSGEIKVDDTRLDTRSADAWRTGVGWMPQAPHFLNQSLRHNLAFGASPDPRILTQAHLDNVIASLPQGDLTTLGESGAGLSGGEARRVMLARALSGGPSLLLADEPTADLDGDTAKIIIEGLLAYTAKGGTLVAATHDPRLIGALGRCIQLEVTL